MAACSYITNYYYLVNVHNEGYQITFGCITPWALFVKQTYAELISV